MLFSTYFYNQFNNVNIIDIILDNVFQGLLQE